jgi:hypothetical protein
VSDKGFSLVVPPCTVRVFLKGEHCEDARPGDFLLVDHGTAASDVLKLGQEIELPKDPGIADFLWCTHTAFMHDSRTVSEMGFLGYERRLLETYRARDYAVVSFEAAPEQLAASIDFDDACQNLDYGWSEYLPIILEAVDRGEFAGSWGDGVVCSVHATLLAMAQGLFPDRWASLVYPALFASWTGARLQGEK